MMNGIRKKKEGMVQPHENHPPMSRPGSKPDARPLQGASAPKYLVQLKANRQCVLYTHGMAVL